jgi:hypothetical protein
MSEWRNVDHLPDDFERAGGQRYWRMRDRDGREFVAKRGYFNNSGFVEQRTNREVWPFEFCDDQPETTLQRPKPT